MLQISWLWLSVGFGAGVVFTLVAAVLIGACLPREVLLKLRETKRYRVMLNQSKCDQIPVQ